MTATTVETIDITPTSWQAYLPCITVLLTDSRDPKAHRAAIDELRRMARAADAYVALQRAQEA